MILITRTFEKLLIKLKSVGIDDIKSEIGKHQLGLENFIEIGLLRNRKVLKGYLLHKKVRILVLFQEKNGNYLPFHIVKKEKKFGKNITKESLSDLSVKLDNIFEDLENEDYKIIES